MNRNATTTTTPESQSDVDAKLTDLNARYERLASTCRQQLTQLEFLSDKLNEFRDDVKQFDAWLLPVSSQLFKNFILLSLVLV